jgi:hypothetical protein
VGSNVNYPHVLNGVGKWYGVQQIRQRASFMTASAAIVYPPGYASSLVKRDSFRRTSTRQTYVSSFTALESGGT